MRPRFTTILGLAACGALGACAHAGGGSGALAAYPGAAGQIEQFYDANATERDWYCNDVQLDNVDQAKLVSQNEQQLVLAVTYFFSPVDPTSRLNRDQCQGFNTRFFTFAKEPGGALSLIAMSGSQRGQGG